MKTTIAACMVLLASTAIAWSQTATICDPTDPSDMTGSCSNTPSSNDSLNLDSGGQGTFDQGTTSAIPQPSQPQGMVPLVVPNDPLNTNLEQNPIGTFTPGGSTGSGFVGGITLPSIQSPSIH